MIQVEHLQHKKWSERESDSMGVFFNKNKKVSVQDKKVEQQDISIFVKVCLGWPCWLLCPFFQKMPFQAPFKVGKEAKCGDGAGEEMGEGDPPS